jgi:ABC-type Fe3+/spermidine/putrescine transport system ATPase subunit
MIEVKDIRKTYGSLTAVDDLSIQISDGQFATIVGPSGSGKSTLLRMLAGHLTPTSGSIESNGIDITHKTPQNRPTCLVFQDGALFPHMTVRENVGYPMEIAENSSDDQIDSLLETVHLDPSEHGDKNPDELSGGQQQRVALARSLAYEPEILLLDEPLGSLDYVLQKQLQRELANLNQELGITFVYVTHSLEAALAMSDKLFVMDNGKLMQQGTPKELYFQPKSKFIAEFMGDCNTIEITVSDRLNGKLEVGSSEIDGIVTVPRRSDIESLPTHMIIRQDDCYINPELSNGFGIEVEIKNILPRGNTAAVEGVSSRSGREYVAEMRLEQIQRNGLDVGMEGYLQWDSNQSTLVPEEA